MGVLPMCHVCTEHAEARGQQQTPGTGAKDHCVLPCGFWELNLDSFPWSTGKAVFLTSEPSLQPFKSCLFVCLTRNLMLAKHSSNTEQNSAP